MIKAFCPGHISCFFSPVRTEDLMTSGSVGAGIRLDKGATATAEERSDGNIGIMIDGTEMDAKVTEHAVRTLAQGRGFDIFIDNDLPISQGLGMSAAGAISSALCVSSIVGADEHDAYRAAHISEIRNGGGLGDVAGITGGRQPIRVRAGIGPYGMIIDAQLDMNVTIAVLGDGISTEKVLLNGDAMGRIAAIGAGCLNEYLDTRTEKKLYEISSRFSYSAGLESAEMKKALSLLREDHMASMCMLGNSLFTDASEKEVREILGEDVATFPCSSCKEGPGLIRRA